MKRTALVTGACGFIGRHMMAALENAGYGVHGIDIDRPFTARGRVERWDARDWFRSDDGTYDLVIHAAAVVGGRAVIDGNPLALAVNLELDAAMFQWAARTRPGRVVYLSSSAAYPVGLQDGLAAVPARLRRLDPRLLREDDIDLDGPERPDSLYGWAKLTGEHLAGLARAGGVPVTVVRPFSGYGEDQDEAYPFPAMAARARDHQDPFVIWGTGEQVRDFIHVDDICAAIVAMVRDGIDGPVNLGTGRPTSMRELAGMFAAASGYEPEFKTLPEMPSGVGYRVADVTRLNEFCQPRLPLEEGVSRVIHPIQRGSE